MITFFIEAITEGTDIMAAVDERDKILKKYLKEWDELGLDLIINPASLMPAPMKVNIHKIFQLFIYQLLRYIVLYYIRNQNNV